MADSPHVRALIKVAITLLIALIGLCGCQHQYIISLRNGDQLLALSKPRTQGTNYYYSAGAGAVFVVPRSHVAHIRAAKVVKATEEPPPPATPAKPNKPKHWYFLWLA